MQAHALGGTWGGEAAPHTRPLFLPPAAEGCTLVSDGVSQISAHVSSFFCFSDQTPSDSLCQFADSSACSNLLLDSASEFFYFSCTFQLWNFYCASFLLL